MGKQLSKQQHKAQVVPFLQDGQYYYNKGLKAYREQNYQKASKYLQKAVELDPNDSVKLSQLATIYTDMGKYSQANELLSYILDELDENMTECHYFMANNFAHLGLFQEAYKCATEYAKQAPFGEFFEENEDLIDLLTMEGDDEEPFLKDPDDLILKQDAAKSLLENSQFEEAILLLEEIVKEYPEFWSAHNNLSLAYFYIGEVEKAKDYLQTVLEKNPGNLHAYCNLLVFYYYERQEDKVDELATMLSTVHPLLFEHRYKLGATFALVGYYPAAYKWLRSLYKQGFEGDDTFYYWLSYSAYFTGHTVFAEQTWERVIKDNKSKIGLEPWNASNEQSDMPVESMSLEDRLYGIFMAIQSNKLSTFKTGQSLQTQLEKDFFEAASANSTDRKIAMLYQITDNLYQKNNHEELLLFAFQILVKAYKMDIPLKNNQAWAAALEYVWMHEEQQEHQSLSQTDIAKVYDISVSTVAKYVKMVRDVFHQQD
ncbi:tetratricopeptide repeat protein [Metabacillus malikii]|uniref:Flp pilus assembly protein TadD n=1 Tax=Metabacillus malikii TaxID=1504265 RepID=A0ABT9ZN01_9BACI|nr:tetratricopeptide repeat protein [Metabacillus malikii]MDQ0233385.1 Flp pilus assembly protein TadD [Metabacillus malikii]